VQSHYDLQVPWANETFDEAVREFTVEYANDAMRG
jgi:hypothetical protein